MDWLIKVGKEVSDERFAVKLDNVVSSNDGDVGISYLTKIFLDLFTNPVCIDIGAEIGWWSVFCAKYGKDPKILAFEPTIEAYKALCKNIEKYPSVQPFPFAISDHEGTLAFTLEDGQTHSRNDSGNLILPCKLLEPFIKDFDIIHLIKMDTEGHEQRILKSIESFFPKIISIIFEYSVYWYGNTYEECIKNSLEMLDKIHSSFPYLYTISRRGVPIQLIGPLDKDQLFVMSHVYYQKKFQVDILASKIRLS